MSIVCWSAFPVAYFSDLSDVLECSNGSGMTGQVSTWLENVTQLGRELGH